MTSPYPRTTQTFSVGDKRTIRYARYRDRDQTQLDPTPLIAEATMQAVDADGNRTGAPINAVSVSVVNDPDDPVKKAWRIRLDATGVAAGRYEWQIHVSGSDPDSQPLNVASVGGIIVLVDRIPEVA